jgi:hypothetical protein
MKTSLAILGLLFSFNSYANTDFTVIYELSQNCDSGFCISKECSAFETSAEGNTTEKVYHDYEGLPRVCDLMEDGEILELTYEKGKCKQLASSSLEKFIPGLHVKDCFRR